MIGALCALGTGFVALIIMIVDKQRKIAKKYK